LHSTYADGRSGLNADEVLAVNARRVRPQQGLLHHRRELQGLAQQAPMPTTASAVRGPKPPPTFAYWYGTTPSSRLREVGGGPGGLPLRCSGLTGER